MPLDQATRTAELVIAYVLILLVAYLAYLSGTGGPDNDLELGLAALLIGISYTLLHGKEGLVQIIRAWRGTENEPRKNRDDADE